MKEIIYIQAGQFANYVGTHFWNTQESYFTYEEGDESDVTHDISFREGQTLKGEATYSPRLLLFDRRTNFGAVSGASGLYGVEDEEEAQEASLWNGPIQEYRQNYVGKSEYHKRLEATTDTQDQSHPHDEGDPGEAKASADDVRYWSDFSRVFFHPRSLHRLPNLADWQNEEGDWSLGKEEFERYDQDADLMEESFRLFVEECDNLQGIQVMNDTATFGGFTDSFLNAVRDELPKLPCLSFPILSNAVPGIIDIDDDVSLRKALNDALVLRGLDELSTLSVPVQAPETWAAGDWLDGIDLNRRSMYHTSAIISAHIESATIPLRLKGASDDMASLCGMLKWGESTRFAHLSGVFPLESPIVPERDFGRRMYGFSVPPLPGQSDSQLEFSRIYVSRGMSSYDRRAFDQWAELKRPLPSSIFAPAYPLPSSFPSFLPPSHSPASAADASSRNPSARLLSSMYATPQTSRLFAAYAGLVEDCVRRRMDLLGEMGVEVDDAKDLRDELWGLRDLYAGAEDGDVGVEDEELGEDEE